jgi:hypothetical protein
LKGVLASAFLSFFTDLPESRLQNMQSVPIRRMVFGTILYVDDNQSLEALKMTNKYGRLSPLAGI